MPMIEQKSYCRICGSGCGIVVQLDGQKVVKVRADLDHPVSQGYTCPKGRAIDVDHHRAERLEVPLIRENGELRAVSWDYMLDDLASKLSGIVDKAGPRGVGTFIGGGGYLDASGFFSMLAFTGKLATPSIYSDMTIDSVAKAYAAEMVTGITGLEPRAHLTNTRMVIFVGTNPVISHTRTIQMHAPTAVMRDMRANGSTLWCIDPRKTETAQRADGHIAPRPGTDYAVLGYVIRELLIDGADFDYLQRHAQNVDDLRTAVSRFSLDYASAVAGVEPGELQAFLAAIRKAGRLSVEAGTGVTMQRAANVTQWLSLALMAVTGSLDREGGAWVNPGRIFQKDKKDFPAAPPQGWQRPGPESRPELQATHGEYPCAAMPDEISAGHLRGLAVFGGNIEVCLPDTRRSMAALRQLEVLAVFDIRHTGTTAIGTHILPTKGLLERSDMTLVTDSAFPLMVSQYTPALLEPIGERKAFWWIIGELGKRMRYDFFPGFDLDRGTDDLFLDYLCKGFGVDFAEIRDRGLIVEEPVIGWVQRFVDAKVGGWRLAPAPLVEQLRLLEAREGKTEPGKLILIPRRQKHHENSKMIDLRDPPQVLMNEKDALAAGVVEGATVRVRSVNGEVRRAMKIDNTLRPGCINVPHGWSDDLNTNLLTGTTDVDSITGMVVFSGLEVSVEPA